MKAFTKEGESDRSHTQETLARIGNPLDTQIEGWLPIASAPLDGTLIRVRDGRWQPCHARFHDDAWRFAEFTSFLPTLWQPIEQI